MTTLKYIGLGALVLILPLAIFAWSGGIQWLTAPFRGALSEREQIQASGDFRIFSYNHFFNLCKSVQDAEVAYDTQKSVLDSMQPSEKGYDRQRRTVAILRADIDQRKQRYNSDAAKEETVAAFKDNSLPDRIPVREHEQGMRTNCN